MKLKSLIVVCGLFAFTTGCKDGGLNIFPLDQDIQLGQQAKQEIESDPATFPILEKSQYPAAYAYLENMRNTILASGQVKYKDRFAWEIYIINDPNTLNAFCTPGGYIYVYTGLIKYLDDASSLAGVLGHEMAHADRRHSTDQLTTQYGVETLLAIALGNNQNQLTEMAKQLGYLKFSRTHETEADNYSVKYLCPTKYHAEGASRFFAKMIADPNSAANPPQFMSTHPNPDNRVANITSQATSSNCAPNNVITQSEEINDYTSFKAMLP